MNYTLLDDAFNFDTTIPNQTTISKPVFSHDCIYCKYKNSEPLTADGTFRRCLNSSCRKEFQAQIQPPQRTVQTPFFQQRHPNEYHMFNQGHLLQQPKEDPSQQRTPMTIQQTQTVPFSHPNYDPQIRYKPL